MDLPERSDKCFICNSANVTWECATGAGDTYCDDCAEDNNYTCKTCGVALIPIED